MEFAWILVALLCGVSFRVLGFPPLIGFLLAGFVLNFLGFKSNHTLESLADIGITLMLFTIGLKLNVRDLLKREIWVGTISHMVLWILLFWTVAWLLSLTSLTYFSTISTQTILLLGFALSFSSTVCVVKILEVSGELKTRHGKLAVGILVMQDVIAVIFLVIATGITPSKWAIALILLYWARPLIGRLLDTAGHGELLPLLGFFLALGGYQLFNAVGLKGDLGALVIGMLLSQHSKAAELSKVLLSFKDLFLIGFFISIGFTALPTGQMLIISVIIALLLPLKFGLYFLLFTRLQLRGRTAYLSGQVLTNFSEFGLIVAALSVNHALLPADWLVILALAVCFSFVTTSLIYQRSHQYYHRFKQTIRRFEHPQRLREDVFHQPKDAHVLVIGMGRVGKGAYEALRQILGDAVWGMDADRERVKKQRREGCKIMLGDAEDVDLWENIDHDAIKLILLALPSIGDISNINQQLTNVGYQGKLAAIARYEDDRHKLLEAGVDNVFNFYTEAGSGFAEESLQLLRPQTQSD